MLVDKLAKFYSQVFPSLPNSGWEFAPYQQFPDLDKELAVRIVLPDGSQDSKALCFLIIILHTFPVAYNERVI